MSYKKKLLCFCFSSCLFIAIGQNNNGKLSSTIDSNAVNSLLLLSKNNFATDPQKAIEYSLQAKNLSEKINFKKGIGLALKNIGIANYYQGKNTEALNYYQQALKLFQSESDDNGVSNLESNIGVIYLNQGNDTKALQYFISSLQIAQKVGNKLRILTAMTNIGAIYSHNDSTFDNALSYYLKALPLAENLSDNEAIGTVSLNIGNIYAKRNEDSIALIYLKKSLEALGNSENSPGSYNAIGNVYLAQKKYDLALQSHKQAFENANKLDGKLDMLQSLEGMAKAYIKLGDRLLAMRYLKQAELIAKTIDAPFELNNVYEYMAICYELMGDYKNAYLSNVLFKKYTDSLYDSDKAQGIARLQFQSHEREIDQLEKDKIVRALELRNQKIARNSLIIGLLLASMLAFFIYRNYRIKAKSNKILDRQNAEIESLLLNILPSEVAKELQATGQSTPRYFESVAVLFTDFKGFTAIADKMTPAEVVKELNTCFMAFDNIVEHHKLEKIKTIGDSYMCAGGLPTYHKDHVCNTVTASVAMLNFIEKYNQERIAKGLEVWAIRIGIHVGPVMAGVVGKKKYAYDIWGSTVNIASRMESNGVAGMVNISKATYELVKNNYVCDHRGKIHAKNVGEIDMYFVRGEIISSYEANAGLQTAAFGLPN